jgi:hypothetical protein
MTKTHSLLSPFNSHPARFARVCLPAQRSRCETLLDRRNHKNNLGTHRHLRQYFNLAPTTRRTARCGGAFKSPSVRLRGLVQPVLSPRRYAEAFYAT